MYLDLSTGHDWPVKKVIVQLVYTVDVKFEVHFWKFIESISLSPLVVMQVTEKSKKTFLDLPQFFCVCCIQIVHLGKKESCHTDNGTCTVTM